MPEVARIHSTSGMDAPAYKAAAVTPSDSTDLAEDARFLYVGVAGHVKVTTAGGSTVTFSNVPVGFFPVRVTRVWSTGTTATGILSCW